MTDLPIACSLTPAQRQDRRRDLLSGLISEAARHETLTSGYRWWFDALHRGDFARLSQRRPLWDLVMLLLLFGVTAGAFTGVYLGFRRIFR